MYIYGKNPVKDLFLNDKNKIKQIWIDKKRHQSFYRDLELEEITLNDISEFNYKKVEFTIHSNTQGIIAKIEEPTIYTINEIIDRNVGKKEKTIAILDKVEDPQNLGAIIRNAAAFGIDAIVYTARGGSKLNSTSMKISAGTWMYVDICEVNSLSQAIELLKKSGYWIISTSLEANVKLEDVSDISDSKVIILGNEGKGVRPSIQAKADYNVKIEMNNLVESLNVASTSAIVFYHLKK